ncbi:MAG: hypothetical protein JWM10_3518 [Myxococcaceae bacterium]|nr:hypothetical protein [Myxococcaceae bacterium]
MTPDQELTVAPPNLSRPIEQWFPSAAVRAACMGCLADVIARAHSLGPARWVLTLTSGSALNLSVGQFLVLRFQDNGDAKIALVESALDAPVTAVFADLGTSSEPFALAPEVVVRALPAEALAVLLPRLRAALEQAVDRAAKTVAHRTGYYSYLSPGALALVEAETGRTLPRPDYGIVDDASPSASPLPPDQGDDHRWSDAELLEAWRTFDPATAPWIADGARLVTEMAAADEATFTARATQQRLWSGRVVASAGMGEAINVSAAFDDPEILRRLDGLRHREWPSDVDDCARAIQAEFDAVMVRLITGLGVRARPTAKLLRTFAILVPTHLTGLLQSDARAKAVRRLLGRAPAGGAIAEQVQIRARLRSVLGDEATLAEHVRRSRFAWRIQAQPPPVLGSIAPPITTPPTPPPSDAPDAPRLELWPIGRQYRGVGAIGGYAGTWRDILRAALPGQSVEVLVDEVRAAGVSASAKTIGYSVSRLYGMELLVREGGLHRPSPEGLLILDGDDAPLVERLLVSTYGFAQLLRFLIAAPNGLPKQELIARIRQRYPAWNSDFVPNVLVAFFVDLGLIEVLPNDHLRLTEYGVQWHARLPEVLPDPAVAATTPVAGLSPSSTTVVATVAAPSFDELKTAFRDAAETRAFVLDDGTLRSLHVAWTCHPSKHFILLSGLSGTGKTAVLRHYAHTWCRVRGLAPKHHLAVVAVSPDWHDPSGLLGYFNPLHEDPTYQIEPALQLLLAADADRANPYFLVLDEMNLARVERYLAPLLSAMETGDPIALHASPEAVNGVPPSVAWPRNLFLAGTVNMDESTHAFSDKVLDRAFTLEFWDVDLPRFFERRSQRHPATEACLMALHDALRPARRHFGYRTAGEVLDFTLGSLGAGESEPNAMDLAVFSKVLPRLRGDQDPDLQRALKLASEIAAQHGLTRSAEKLRVMQQRLQATGVTRFWS